jgi:hypothetical protein
LCSSLLKEREFCFLRDRKEIVFYNLGERLNAKILSYLRRLMDGLLSRRPMFDASSFLLRFEVDKVTMEQEDSIMVLRHSPMSNVPQLLHVHFHCNTNLKGSTGERRLGTFK